MTIPQNRHFHFKRYQHFKLNRNGMQTNNQNKTFKYLKHVKTEVNSNLNIINGKRQHTCLEV